MLQLRELLVGAAAQAPVVVSQGAQEFTQIAHDSRNVVGGELFVALRTANGDGHTFVAEAYERGARGFLIERPVGDLVPWSSPEWRGPLPTVVQVRSCREALVDWAELRLGHSQLAVIAGSLGKSTAQAALRTAWAESGGLPVIGNGDRNDALGIPLALSAEPPRPGRVVLETVAADRREEVLLARMLRPQVFCVTTTADAAALYWQSPSALGAVLARLAPTEARLVAPLSDAGLGPRFLNRSAFTFGPLGSGAKVELGPGPEGSRWPQAWSCRVVAGGRSWNVPSRLHPTVTQTAWGVALAAILALGLDLSPALAALSRLGPLPGRLSLRPGAVGGQVLDDSVDATPLSMALAAEALQSLPKPRLAVVGAGPWRLATAPGTALVVLDENFGRGSQAAPEAARLATTVSQAEALAEPVLRRGGSVLIKGAAGRRLERLTARLAGPGTPLLRQERGRQLVGFRSSRRPTWVEVDLAALGDNVAEVVAELAPVPLMAVVKADAYGHGAVQVARTALARGAAWVATATLAEAVQLRQAGVAAPCLVLGYTPPSQVGEAVALGLVLTVFDVEVLAALEAAGERAGRPARAHLKVDTGMSRLGIPPPAVGAFVAEVQGLPHVDLEGIYTHFRKGQDPASARSQLALLLAAVGLAEAQGHRFRIRHAANSAAWHHLPEARLDLVRCGGELLGLMTGDGRRRRPVLSFKTTVAQIHDLAAGAYVGYGDVFRAPHAMRVATIPVGYGDGFRRGPGNWGSVLIRGRQHRLVGDVSMDLAMVDVSSDPAVSRGDPVVLIGRQGGLEVSAEEVASRLGTINYEVVTQILARVPREVAAP